MGIWGITFVRDWLQIIMLVRLLLGTSTGSPESRRKTVEHSFSPSTTPTYAGDTNDTPVS
jgi:hypothetical protein